jgi:phosphate transport system permease protein
MDAAQLRRVVAKRRREDFWFTIAGAACTLLGLVTLGALFYNLMHDGLHRLDWTLLSSFPSRFAERAGVLSAWVGSLLIMLVTALSAIPLGVAAGVYLEEYGKKNWRTTLIELNIANLAGVPSIIYGLMALGLFVYMLGLGRSILAGGLTLACLILPIIIVATREALRSIPQEIREAAYGMGASKWQVIWHHLLPYSTGGISTGIIIGLSRAIGETAPLITIGALTFIAFLPFNTASELVTLRWLDNQFTVLPIQMFNWVSRPGVEFQANAAAAGLLLIAITLSMNAVAIVVRYRMRKRIKW